MTTPDLPVCDRCPLVLVYAVSLRLGRCLHCRAAEPTEAPAAVPPVKTADQGRPEPPPYAGSEWAYESAKERAGKLVERVPNADG